jgi:hypothetical protein
LGLACDRHDLRPALLPDIEYVQDAHDLVQVRPNMSVLQAADALTRDADRLGEPVGRIAVIFPQANEFGREPAATDKGTDHRTNLRHRCNHSTALSFPWTVGAARA